MLNSNWTRVLLQAIIESKDIHCLNNDFENMSRSIYSDINEEEMKKDTWRRTSGRVTGNKVLNV